MLVKTSTLILLYLLFYNNPAKTQPSHKPQLEVSGSLDFGLSEGYPLGGLGGQVKGLWQIGKRNDAIVAALGFDRLYEDLEYDAYSYTFVLTSVGYRKHIKAVFIEPKIGLGICNGFDENDVSMFIGVEPGIEKRKFRFSIDYRFISVDGLIEGDYFHTFAFRVSYKIF